MKKLFQKFKNFFTLSIFLFSFLIAGQSYAYTVFDTGILSSTLDGFNGTTARYGASFTTTAGVTDIVQIQLYDVNNATDGNTRHIHIYTNANETGLICTSNNVSTIGYTYGQLVTFSFSGCSVSENTTYYWYENWVSGTSLWKSMTRSPGTDVVAGTAMYKNGALFGTNDIGFKVIATDFPYCGDTYVNGTEECDDGNTDPDDGCSESCMIEHCGDGVIQLGEQCDDGNTANLDGCNSTCQNEVTNMVDFQSNDFYNKSLDSAGAYFAPFGKFLYMILGFFLALFVIAILIRAVIKKIW